MQLRSLYLHNFRVYEEAHFEFSPSVNLIVGPNARGKTTILEAIYLLISGRSFRTSQIKDLIRHERDHFFLEATFVKHGLEQRLKMSFNGEERKIIYNNTTYPTVASLLGVLKGVIICPDDASLVKGQPALRRHFLDLQIAQVDPLYVHHLTRYMRGMRHRNALLRYKKVDSIEPWEQEMAISASYVTEHRKGVTNELQEIGRGLHASLTEDPSSSLSLNYKTSAIFAEKQYFLDQFAKHRKRELELGFTLVGPHKDDLQIALQDKEVRHFASEGQQRTCVAALRLAEWERMGKRGDGIPLMMVDDVGTSLDESRRNRLYNHFSEMGQVFLTSTHDINMKNVFRLSLI